MKTFVKWSGNKSRYVKHILPMIPNDMNTYFEPFLGSGAVFLKLQPAKWIINDFNKDIINAWKYIRESPNEIIEQFIKFGRKFTKLDTIARKDYCRAQTYLMAALPYNLQRAALYLIVKDCAYNGLLLKKQKYYFNGLDMNLYENKHPYFFSKRFYDLLLKTNMFLNDTKGKIFNSDYKKILAKCKQGDFVFLDPPYVEDHNYDFKYNFNEKLDDTFTQKLYNQVQALDEKGVRWLMTQADTKHVRTLFKKYNISSYAVYRRQSKQYKTELIIKNY